MGGTTMAALALAGVALAGALSGCETTQEKSARLERTAHHAHLSRRGPSIARASADVRVVSTTLVHGSEGNAAVITLRDDSGETLKDVPIAITVKDAQGSIVFQNNTPGLEAALTSLASLPAHGEATWVNDQVQASSSSSSGTPASVSATVGEAPSASGPTPRIEVRGVHQSEEGSTTGAAGTVHNGSGVSQQNLVVYVLAWRAGRIVAAGRAVLPEVGAGASVPFQAFLQGDASGARLQASAPPTTFG